MGLLLSGWREGGKEGKGKRRDKEKKGRGQAPNILS